MRLELLYNPRLLCERLAEISLSARRIAKLRGTVASNLKSGHIDSLELLELLSGDPPAVIYDIGANVGTWTLLAKAVFPSSEIHAFEPLPGHVESFRRNTTNVPDVQLHELCLGASEGELPMKVTDFSDASSLLPLTEVGRRQWNLAQTEEILLRVETLDSWISMNALRTPDLIKLDVQGYELEVLKGSEIALAHTRAVILEASFQNFYEGQCRFDELVSILAKNGLHLHAIGNGTAIGRRLIQSDLLFVRE